MQPRYLCVLAQIRMYVDYNLFIIGNSLPQPTDIDKIFEVIAEKEKWSYLNYSPLCELLEEFVNMRGSIWGYGYPYYRYKWHKMYILCDFSLLA